MVLLESKTVVSMDKNIKDSLEILQVSRKTPAPPRQCWDIVAQISVDTFHREGVILNANQELKRGRKTAQKSRECKYVANKSHKALLRCLRPL